jgi:3-phenylpropionate/trans-cinnamate dioxygenase ferredoxin subunit
MSAQPREARIPAHAAPAVGEVRLLEVGRHRIGVFRIEDEFYALADRCPHRGAPLCSAGEVATPIEASGETLTIGPPLSVVRCPWHKWDFEIRTGQCTVDPRLRVRRYVVRSEGGDLVVSLDARAADESEPEL